MIQGIVRRYLLDKHYGFIVPLSGGDDVFFHDSNFDGLGGPPPITDEVIEFEMEEGQRRASSVIRRMVPAKFSGVVTNYDPVKGYGFVRTSEGKTFYLHKSEVISKSIPMRKAIVDFYAVSANDVGGKSPRACYVTVMG